jgi:signal transduction histidine kinase
MNSPAQLFHEWRLPVAAANLQLNPKKRIGLALHQAHKLIEILPHATAVWTRRRESGIFNAAACELFGFCGRDLIDGDSWLERVHPQDRDELRSSVERVYGGAGAVRIDYRFSPEGRAEPINVTELMALYKSPADRSLETWSVYSESAPSPSPNQAVEGKRLHELWLGLNHDVSNNLQAIKGEFALLKIAGEISEQSSSAINYGVANIKKLLLEIGEYLSPSPLEFNIENPALVFAEVLRESEVELAEHHIGISFVMQEPLPSIPIGRQLRNALREVIRFSCALLPNGGEVKIETGLISTDRGREMEIRVINASPSKLGMEEVDVFRPFLNINGCRIGLSMAVAREILRRHSGKIVFRREQRNRAVFSIRLQMPSTGECPDIAEF